MGIKLNLDSLNKSVVAQPQQPVPVKGLKITAVPDKEYNLDEIILNIRRDNSNAALLVQIDYSDLNNQQFIELMTKYVLDEEGISYNENNFKDSSIINQVENFAAKLETMCKKYYDIYFKYLGEVKDGSISITTVFEKISLAHEDYEKYLLADSSVNRGLTIDVGTNNKPSFIVEEGTTDPLEEGGDEFSILTRMKEIEKNLSDVNDELDETVKKSQIATDFETATDEQLPTIAHVRVIADEASYGGIMVASPYDEETGTITLETEGNLDSYDYDDDTGVLTLEFN